MKNQLCSFIRMGFLTLILTLYFFSSTNAQHFIFGAQRAKIEAGVNFGPTFFLGDLGGHRGIGTTFIKDVNMQLTKMMKGAFISIYPTEWLGFRVAAQYTYLEGRDNLIVNNGGLELYRKERNLDFKSNLFEAYAAIEIFPLQLFNINSEDYDPIFQPYGFIGAGMFRYNPKGSLTDRQGNVTWHELHPLRTEGQGFGEYPLVKQYSLTQLNMPMGGGIKYKLSERVSTALELLYRKTFTDYIDDLSTDYVDPALFDKYLLPADAVIAKQIYDKTYVGFVPGSSRFTPGAQRGNVKQNDAYFSFVLKLGIQLGNIYNSDRERNMANTTRCPARF
ncbi:MAG: hypothetical protein ABIN01_19055 [Ferruginibacter sp.]